MAKKKILFLIGSLESGGVSKSMVNLLQVIDKETYDITLWCGSRKGVFSKLVPHEVHVDENPTREALLNGFKGIWTLLKLGHFLLAMGSVVRLFLSKIDKGYAGWWLSRLLPTVNESFDLIVDYNGQHQLYYMVDKLHGSKKLTFFHSDYAKWPYYYKMDKRYFPKVDAIFSISPQCVQSLKEYFPEVAEKIHLMENISSKSLIDKLSEERILDFDGDVKILTIGHLCKNKGTDLAIKAAALLTKKGVDFTWYFLGLEKEDYSSLIKDCQVEDRIVRLGMRVNPYPYIKQATIIVHPSLFEGKSIALDEAKLLHKPIVVTNFSTVKDQFEDGVNALVASFSPEDIASKILDLLHNEKLCNELQANLVNNTRDNSDEINKLYRYM